VYAELEHALLGSVRTEAAAAHVLPIGAEEEGPVLDPVRRLRRDLALQSLFDCGAARWSSDEAGDLGIVPEPEREPEIIGAPDTKAEPSRPQKVHERASSRSASASRQTSRDIARRVGPAFSPLDAPYRALP